MPVESVSGSFGSMEPRNESVDSTAANTTSEKGLSCSPAGSDVAAGVFRIVFGSDDPCSGLSAAFGAAGDSAVTSVAYPGCNETPASSWAAQDAATDRLS